MHRYLDSRDGSIMSNKYLDAFGASQITDAERAGIESSGTEIKRAGSLVSAGTDLVRTGGGSVASRKDSAISKMTLERDQTAMFDNQMSKFESAQGNEANKDENKMFEEMERAVMMEREKILHETDNRISKMENSHRDSVLKGRGFSMKLNIDAIGMQKSN